MDRLRPVRSRTTELVLVLLLAGCEGWELRPIDQKQLKTIDGLVTYEGQPYSGFSFVNYPSGVIKEKRHYQAGKLHGVQKHWFENGTPLWENAYRLGNKDGEQFGWHANGRKRYLGHYIQGKKDGEQWSWHDNGQVASYYLVQNDQEVAYKQWRPDGKVFTNYQRHDDEKFGIEGNELCQTVREAQDKAAAAAPPDQLLPKQP